MWAAHPGRLAHTPAPRLQHGHVLGLRRTSEAVACSTGRGPRMRFRDPLSPRQQAWGPHSHMSSRWTLSHSRENLRGFLLMDEETKASEMLRSNCAQTTQSEQGLKPSLPCWPALTLQPCWPRWTPLASARLREGFWGLGHPQDLAPCVLQTSTWPSLCPDLEDGVSALNTAPAGAREEARDSCVLPRLSLGLVCTRGEVRRAWT